MTTKREHNSTQGFINTDAISTVYNNSNELIIELIKTKCFPVLHYGLEACPLRKSQYKLNSTDYVINSSFRIIFDTRSQEVIDVCLGMFNSPLFTSTASCCLT